MSVQSQINRISGAVSDALAALTEKGVTVPVGTKVDGLASLIAAIEAGGGAGRNIATGTFTTNDITSNVEISHGLGEQPSAFCVYNCGEQGFIVQSTVNWLRFIYGAILDEKYYVLYSKVGSSSVGGTGVNLDFAATGTSGAFAYYVNVSSEKIIIKQKSFNSTYGIGSGNTFRWFAVGPDS